jgi:hypothetical protein
MKHSHFCIIRFFLRLICWLFNFLPYDLNLKIEGLTMSKKIGETLTATITPTQTLADGSKVPAPVTNPTFTVSPVGAYTVAPSADGMSATLTAATVAVGCTCTATAVNAEGVTLTQTVTIDDVVPAVPVADALNLTVV